MPVVEVDDLGVRKRGEVGEDSGGLANGFDFITFNNDASFFKNSGIGVHSDDHGVVDYRH